MSEFVCQNCSAKLPAYLPDDHCPECQLPLDQDALAGLRRTNANMDVTVQPGKTEPGRANVADGDNESLGEKEFGDYILIDEIARGGMGVVYRARQKGLDRIVALKMILDGQFASQLEKDRFKIEAQSAANLDHPGIVPIYEIGENEGHQFFSMALIEGQSLADRIKENSLTEMEAAKLLKSVSEAMHFAHQRGIIHRDLKPDNILLDQRGSPRITDFGLAKQPGSERELTVTGQTLGTPSYMSPEQASGRGDVTDATDVYALGAILYAMLTGDPPFRGMTLIDTLTQVIEQEPIPPIQHVAGISSDLNLICLKCLEKDPAERYNSAQDLVDELERFLNGEPVNVQPLSPWGKFKRWRRIIARNKDVRLRSATSVFGYPLVDIAFGRDAETHEEFGTARGIFAFGDVAYGLFAFGRHSRGIIFAYGLYPVGTISFGLFSAGILTSGFASIGLVATGGFTLGYLAMGFCAIGFKALGFIAMGPSAFGFMGWRWSAIQAPGKLLMLLKPTAHFLMRLTRF